ncbi:E3 ubiquitin-protein ligase CHIP [Dendrobium catenatum]|uniref:RING-type E3 ubiquitin transferase n=1 Tax=Dendrobium catenatum TaxID=906689 RepID=A0A2I0WWF6_9ASPA|nr:E3 ubiquitin-protein ligase CHIP [Dendrobium catenatum]
MDANGSTGVRFGCNGEDNPSLDRRKANACESDGAAPKSFLAQMNASGGTSKAELLRLHGNVAFKKERIGAAIDAYTEAITLCPDVAVYWTNRALCYYKRKDWNRVEEDCRSAIKLDGSSVKVSSPHLV